jgi:two-component system, chemotaxis family, sensor kinase CheA
LSPSEVPLDRSELIRRLLAIFVVELQDHLRVFNQELLTLEQRAPGLNTAESINTLFRSVHSLKGAARSVDATRLARVCHALEAILSPLREGNAELSTELFALLFESADALAIAAKELQAGATDGSMQVMNALERRIEAFGHTIASSRPPPSVSLIGDDSVPPQPPAAVASERPFTPLPEAKLVPSIMPPKAAVPMGPAAVLPPNMQLPAAGDSSPQASAGEPPVQPPVTATRTTLMSFVLAGPDSRVSDSRPAPEAQTDEHASIRVPVRRLDALLWRSGELSVARRRFEGRRDELAAVHEAVAHLRGRLRGHAEQSRQRVRNHEDAPATGSKTERFLQGTAESLERVENELSRLSAAISDDVRGLERAAAPLEAEVHNVRLLAFGESCEGLQRAVRDLAKSSGKDVELVIEGATLELDRAIIEGARSALMHLVRNAVDHGIETPAERLARGKPARSTLSVRAAVRGDRVEVSVGDDGRGIDLDELRAQARRRGLVPPEDERELVAMIFRPGFSTARVVTDVSGRGVGLDVVCTQVESLRGELEVAFEKGQGTTFRMRLPLTASSLRGLLVQVSEQLFALPNSHVQSLMRVGPESIARSEGREVLLGPGGPVPLCSLGDVLALAGKETVERRDGGERKLQVVVLAADGRSVALTVDRWLAEQDLVIKPFGRRVRRLRHVSAAAVLPTGQVSLVLKPHELVRSAYALRPRASLGQLLAPSEAVKKRRRVLLADDSVTTRTLEKSILESAGYEVITAADGEQAFKLLQERGADIVVSDVEMPRMDGHMLAQAIRGSQRFRDLPVVLLTALGSEEDRARGLASGASAYLVKTAFDQDNLLKTLRQLM